MFAVGIRNRSECRPRSLSHFSHCTPHDMGFFFTQLLTGPVPPQSNALKQVCDPVNCQIGRKIFFIVRILRPFLYLGFYITFNTVQVISRWVALWGNLYIGVSQGSVCCRPSVNPFLHSIVHARISWLLRKRG